MLKTLLLTFIIIVICVVLLCVKVLLKKGGRFPNTHIEGNKALAKKGIYCAKSIVCKFSIRIYMIDWKNKLIKNKKIIFYIL